MIGLEFLCHGNRFAARVRRRYFSAERSDSRKYVFVRRLEFRGLTGQFFKLGNIQGSSLNC